MTTPTERRYAAIRAAYTYLVDTETGRVKPGMTRHEASDYLTRLLPLGRTQRWNVAVNQWRALIEDRENDLSWAITQGAIWIGYQA